MDIDGRFICKTLQGLGNVLKGNFWLINGIKFVDGKNDGGYAQQFQQQTVATGLG